MSTSRSEHAAAGLAADYFDGRSSRRQAVVLSIVDGTLRLDGDVAHRVEPLSAVRVSEPMGDAPRTLRFADDAYCEVRDRSGLAAMLAAAGVGKSAMVRAQARWRWALTALAGMIAFVAAAYVWALPWLASAIAPSIPAPVTRALSETALQALDAHLLAPSKLPAARRAAIAARVATLPALPPHRLLFRAAPAVGPNAFALPNGDVVIFDELVTLAADDGDVAAVVAHELGHVRHHHGLRQLIQSAVVSFVVGAYFGDVSSAAASLGALAMESRYSREFEREADAFAARLLLAAVGSAEPLARMLDRIEEEHARRHAAKRGDGGGAGIFSSHPDTTARIAALREQSRPEQRPAVGGRGPVDGSR